MGHELGVGEDHHPVIDVRIQDVFEAFVLFFPGHLDHVLADLRAVFIDGLHGDLGGLMLVLPGDGHHVLAGGGGVHDELAVLGRPVDDAAHVLDEAHVQHLVRLVQHQGVDGVQGKALPLQVVQHPAGRAHDDLGLLAQLVQLAADGLAAVEHGDADLGDIVGELSQLVADLHGQLPGGGQDQLLNAGVVWVHVFQHGDPEGAGLARAGRGDADDVLPLHHQRDGLLLDGGGFVEAHAGQGAQDLGGYVQPFKAGRGDRAFIRHFFRRGLVLVGGLSWGVLALFPWAALSWGALPGRFFGGLFAGRRGLCFSP